MIPVLYEPNETDFSTNGVGLLVDAVSCIVTEERNGAYEIVLEYPQGGPLAHVIAEEYIVKAKPNDTDDDQLFRLYKSGKPIAGNDTWYGEHISYELSENPVCRPEIKGKNAQEAIMQLLAEASLRTPYTAYSDIETRNDTKIREVVSIRKALGGVEGSIIDVWGGEYRFNNYRIELLKARGSDKGIEIRYGKNMLDAQIEKSLGEVVTAIYPFAFYTHETEGEEEAEEIFVALPEKIIYTPKKDDYARIRCVPVDFSEDFEEGEVITEAALREKANRYAQSGIDEPKIHITTSFVNLWKTKEFEAIKALEKVGLCDTVTVIIERHNIREKAKVIKYSYNTLKERFESVEIGEIRPNLAKEVSKQEQKAKARIERTATRAELIRQQIEKTIKDVTAAITGNSGGYVVLYPEKNPQEIMILDTPDVKTAKNVWRWNLAGLGYSSNGTAGPFKTAITADGKIVADFVATGELNGAIIKAGSIVAETLDVEYRESVKKYADDGDAELVKDYSAKFKTTTDAIEAEVQRSSEAEGTLRAAITTTAEGIKAEVTRATEAEGTLSAAITENADAIKLKVSKGDLSAEISAEAGEITISSDRFSLSSTNCTITKDGKITASNCELSGKITASSGEIGGFTIGSSAIYNGTNSITSNTNGIYIGTDGIRDKNTLGTTTIHNGKITTDQAEITGGTIGGFTIGTSAIYNGTNSITSSTNGIYIGTDGIRDKNTLGTTTIHNGKITTDKAEITGGEIGGFTIGTTSIYNGKSTLASSTAGVYIGTDGISIGTYGSYTAFKITKDGEIDLRGKGSLDFISTGNQMSLASTGIKFGTGSAYNTEITKDKVKIYNTYIDKDAVHCAKYNNANTYCADINGNSIELTASSSTYKTTITNSGISFGNSQVFSVESKDAGITVNSGNISITGNTKISIGARHTSGYATQVLAFFGGTGSKQQTVAAATSSTILTQLNAVITALKNYGLFS